MAYAILRVAKLKTAGQVSAVGGHNARSRETPNANEEVPNRVLAGDGGDAWPAVMARIEGAKARIRKNGVLACEVFLGASPEYFRPKAGSPAGTWDAARLDDWQGRAWQWLQDEWGKDNVVSAVVHLDEATPHLQAVVVPIDPKSGRMNAARWLDGRKALSEMQDRYGVAMRPLGLERGIRGSTAEHTEVREWYGHLQAKTPTIPTPVVNPPEGAMAVLTEAKREAYAEGETERLKDLQGPQVEILQTKARAYELTEKKRDEYEATAKRLAKEVEELKTKLAEATKEADEWRRKGEIFRPVPLSQVATWFSKEELAEARVTLGKNKEGQERIFDLDSRLVVGRNGIDLAMKVGKTGYRGAIEDLVVRSGSIDMAQRVVVSSTAEVMKEAMQKVVSAPVIEHRLQRAAQASTKASFDQMGQVFKRHGFNLSVSTKGKEPEVKVEEVFTRKQQQVGEQLQRMILEAHSRAEIERRQQRAREEADIRRRMPPPSHGMSR